MLNSKRKVQASNFERRGFTVSRLQVDRAFARRTGRCKTLEMNLQEMEGIDKKNRKGKIIETEN